MMLEELQRRNYSAVTTRNYLRVVADFVKFFGKSPDKLGLNRRVRAWRTNDRCARCDRPPRRRLRDDRSSLCGAVPQPADLRELASRVPAVHFDPAQPGLQFGSVRPRTAPSVPVGAAVRHRLQSVAA